MISCTFENGNKGSLRHVTVDGVIVKGNKILLVKRAPSLVEGGKWAVPGGYVDRDETVGQAVRREVAEETGYQATHAIFLGMIDNPKRRGDNRQNVTFVFFVTVGQKTAKADWESTKQQWFGLDALPNKEEIAFDHAAIINLYLLYKQKPKRFPIIP